MEIAGNFGQGPVWTGDRKIVDRVKRLFHINSGVEIWEGMLKTLLKRGKIRCQEVARMFLMMSSTVSR